MMTSSKVFRKDCSQKVIKGWRDYAMRKVQEKEQFLMKVHSKPIFVRSLNSWMKYIPNEVVRNDN